jgi:hypothetical protein
MIFTSISLVNCTRGYQIPSCNTDQAYHGEQRTCLAPRSNTSLGSKYAKNKENKKKTELRMLMCHTVFIFHTPDVTLRGLPCTVAC